MLFFIIFILIPLAEIMVFANVGTEIGLLNTLLLALLTAVIGGFIVRKQGIETLFAIRKSLDQGKVPTHELFDGICLIAAGATLITPGFITDTAGFLLLIPQIRKALRKVALQYFKVHSQEQNQKHSDQSGVIEGDYETLDEENNKKR